MFVYTFNFETITSIATVFIAVLALGLTIWQGWMSRRHNYNSVCPLLTYETHNTTNTKDFGIYIKNNGTGPAIINDMKFFVDGEEVEEVSNDSWDYILKKLKLPLTNIISATFDNESVLSAGERQFLISIGEQANVEQKSNLKKIFPRIGIEIYYESIYGIKDVANYNWR